MLFAALHMSACGTSRRFAATHRLGRYWRHSGHEWPRRLGKKCRDWPNSDIGELPPTHFHAAGLTPRPSVAFG